MRRLLWVVLLTGAGLCSSTSAQDAKVLAVLEVTDVAALKQPKSFNPVLTYNAELQLNHDDRADRNWITVTFDKPNEGSRYDFSAVFFETSYEIVVPPFEGRRFPDGGPDWPNVWQGYDRFVFDYRNQSAAPVKATVLAQDYVSWLPLKWDGLALVNPRGAKQKDLPQLYEEEVVLKPGTGTAAIKLRKPMWTNQRDKGLGLDDIKAFGLCIKSPAAKTVIGVNRFRLEGKDRNAGVFRYPERVECPGCGKATSDRYAPFCPFCGAEMKSYEPIPKELPRFGQDHVLLKLIDAGGGGSNSGGGQDTTEVIAGPTGSRAIRHYDVYYNRAKGTQPIPERKKIPWEYRYQLKFAIGPEFSQKPRIKNATLWLSAALQIKDRAEPIFSQKPWMPGVLAFSVNDAYNGWDGKKVNFTKTPPYEKLIYVSGQHPDSATQNPKLRVEGKDAPTCLPLDITEYVQEAIDGGKKSFTIALKAFTPFGAIKDPHGYGHTMNFFAMGSEKSAVIAVELRK